MISYIFPPVPRSLKSSPKGHRSCRSLTKGCGSTCCTATVGLLTISSSSDRGKKQQQLMTLCTVYMHVHVHLCNVSIVFIYMYVNCCSETFWSCILATQVNITRPYCTCTCAVCVTMPHAYAHIHVMGHVRYHFHWCLWVELEAALLALLWGHHQKWHTALCLHHHCLAKLELYTEYTWKWAQKWQHQNLFSILKKYPALHWTCKQHKWIEESTPYI